MQYLWVLLGQGLNLVPHLLSLFQLVFLSTDRHTTLSKVHTLTLSRILMCVCVCVLLLFLSLVLLRAVVKQFLVHLHKELQSVVDQTVDCPEHTQVRVIKPVRGRRWRQSQGWWAGDTHHIYM